MPSRSATALADPAVHEGVDLHPFDADLGAHEQQPVEGAREGADVAHRLVRLHGQPGRGAAVGHAGECGGQVAGASPVHGHDVGPRLEEGADPDVGVRDHEMDLDRQLGPLAHGGDEVGTEQQLRGEMPVGDVDVEAVGMARHAVDVASDVERVGRPQRDEGLHASTS
ncbi:hypothetical protein GCM10020219_077580 [Nonomuraea dietziae]